MARLSLDSGVILQGFIADFGASKAVMILCAMRVHTIVLAADVQTEVERNLIRQYTRRKLPSRRLDRLIADYVLFFNKARIENFPTANRNDTEAARFLIRHRNDAPVLAAAINAQPDWLLSTNTEHFTPEVAHKTGLRIADPENFLRYVHRHA